MELEDLPEEDNTYECGCNIKISNRTIIIDSCKSHKWRIENEKKQAL